MKAIKRNFKHYKNFESGEVHPVIENKISWEDELKGKVKKSINKKQGKVSVQQRVEHIKKSIENNKARFVIKKDEQGVEHVVPQTKRGQFLNDLIDNFDTEIDKIENMYYSGSFDFSSIETTSKSSDIKEVLYQHETTLYEQRVETWKNEEYGLGFYMREVRSYISHYFPLKKKNERKKSKEVGNRKNYDKKYLDQHLNVGIIKSTVRKQLKNQIANHILSVGKLIRYKNFAEEKDGAYYFTSDVLERIRANEAFKSVLIRLQNIIEQKLFKTKGIPVQGLKRESEKWKKAYHDEGLVEVLLGLIAYDLRVSCYHSKIDTLWEMGIFQGEVTKDFEEFETSEEFTKMQLIEIDKDMNELEQAYLQRIASMKLIQYYETTNVIDILNSITFALVSRSTTYLPSFKNVFKKGMNIQNADSKEEKVVSENGWYCTFEEEVFNEKALAYKNLLQLIYKQCFLKEIYTKRDLFNCAVNRVLDVGKKNAINRKTSNNNAWKYNGFREMKDDETVELFLSSLQQSIMQIDAENNNDSTKEQQSNRYREFVLDVTMVAFNEYLESTYKNKKRWMQNPSETLGIGEEVFLAECLEEKQVKLKIEKANFYEDKEKVVQIFALMNYLDNEDISEFQQACMKYQQSPRLSWFSLEEIKKQERTLVQILEIGELVKVTRKPLRNSLSSLDKESAYQEIKLCVEGEIEEYVDLYYQKDGSDEHKDNYIFRAPLFKFLHQHNSRLYQLINDEQGGELRIYKSEYEEYVNMNQGEDSKIAQLQKQRKELHQEFLSKGKNFDKYKEYEYVMKEIMDYQFLKNKLEFTSLYQLHRLDTELATRFASFAQHWERDFFYVLNYLEFEKGMKEINVEERFEKGSVIGIYHKSVKNEEIEKFLKRNFVDLSSNDGIGGIRNRLAHLDLLKEDNGKEKTSIVQVMNDLRKLFAYDRKMKNSITKSVIEMLDREGYVLEFKTKDKHEFEIKEIEAKITKHLKRDVRKGKGKKEEYTPISQHSKSEVSMVRKMLEVKH